MRLIDADALMNQYKRIDWYSVSKSGGLMRGATSEDNPVIHYYDGEEVIDNAPTIEAEPVRHGPCPYCDAETNDFVPINQTVEYSGIEIALNRQGMLRVRVYESGQETFTTQDIVEIKCCPNCGAKMDLEG